MVTTTSLNIQSSNRRIKKSYLLSVLSENKIFIIFSFLACLMPIGYCLLACMIQPNGSQAVMAMGHVMPFLLAFIQISFSITMIIFAKLRDLRQMHEKQNTYVIISATIWMSLFIGFIMVLCYVLSCFAYMYFSNNRPNTQAMLTYGLNFVWSTIPFVLLYPILIVSIFAIRRKDKTTALMLTITSFMFMVLFSFLFGNLLNLKIAGFGLGLTTGLLISLFINYSFICIFMPFRVYSPLSVKDFNILISKTIIKESLTLISMSLFKGIAIICLSFSIPYTISNFVPLSYQMSRVIWFNMMYFIPFIGIGVGEGIRFHYLSMHSEFSPHNCYLEHSWKNDNKMIFATLFVTILIAVGCFFLVEPLNVIYAINDNNLFEDGRMPEIEGWGTPTLAPKEFINFQNLKNLNFTEFPDLTPLKEMTGNPIKDAIIKIQNAQIIKDNLKLVSDWVDLQIQNNKDSLGQIKTDLESIKTWYAWLNQTNDQGVTILQYLEQQAGNNFSLSNVIKNLVDGNQLTPDEINGLMSIAKNSMSYFVYLWLYSNVTPTVTDSFLLLRSFMNYHNLLDSGNLLTVLVNNDLSSILTSLFLKINTFDAKAMIYISVFGIANSVWAILIQVNQRNLKEGMPYWMLTFIYGFCIGFLVVFGTLFAVTFKEKLGMNNPFNYLDAWTFPLVVISFAAIVVLGTKNIVSWKKYYKEKEGTSNVKVY